jgi:uncharacterized protein YceK
MFGKVLTRRVGVVAALHRTIKEDRTKGIMSNSLRLRSVLTTLVLALGVSGGAALATAPTAAANWSSSYAGVSYGWSNDHAWAVGSYQALETADTSAVAGVVCGAAGLPPWLCAGAVGAVFYNLTRGQPRWTNHGVWVAIYPRQFWNWSWTGGRY